MNFQSIENNRPTKILTLANVGINRRVGEPSVVSRASARAGKRLSVARVAAPTNHIATGAGRGHRVRGAAREQPPRVDCRSIKVHRRTSLG